MKTRNIFYLASAFFMMSCAEEFLPESNTGVTPDQEITYVQKTFTAGIEGVSSKTALVDDCKIEWKANDQVAVLDGISSSPILYKAAEAGPVTTLKSDKGVASGATEFYAFYPYRDKFTLTDDVISGCYLNPDQKPSRGGFYVASHFIMSKADAVDNFTFKNLNGFIKVRIPEELNEKVQAIYVFSNNDEEIAGSFKAKWNDGEPTIEYVSESSKKPYVRAFNTTKVNGVETITPLRQGDYYISILPTEFEKGLTLVLQMADGTTQLSKRTENRVVVKENQILPITTLTVEDFDTDNINYFVLWNEGFTFAMGGVEVNKTNYPTSELRTKTQKSAINASSGLFFLTPSASVDLSGTETLVVDDLCVLGTEKNYRSTAYLKQHIDLKKGGKNYLLANLVLTTASKKSFICGDVGEFSNVTVKNCSFKGLTASPFNLSQESNYAVEMNKFVMEDSEFGFNVDYAVNCLHNKKTAQFSSIDELVINNNIFYALNENAVSITYISTDSDQGTDLRRMVFTNNTVANLKVNGAAFTNARNFVEGGELDLYNNLFYVTLDTQGKTTYDVLNMPGGVNRPESMNIGNNYYKCINDNTHTFRVRSWGTSESVIPLSINPLSGIWDPANGTFGAYTIVPKEGDAPVESVGAQRPDMDPMTSAINSAAYGYTTDDAGSF